MIQEAVIAAFVLVTLERAIGHDVPTWAPVGGRAWVMCITPFLVLAVMAQVWSWLALRNLNRGRVIAALSLERFLLVVRGLGLAAHAVNCIVLGWPTLVRSAIGDQVALDEFVAASPPLLLVVGSWWWFYPLERRLRESVLARQLHEGTPVTPWPSRWSYVVFWARQSLLPVVVPIVLIAFWSEAVDAGWKAFGGNADESPGYLDVIRFVGVLAMIVVGPVLLRRVWQTERLADSPLRERLAEVCRRNGVRVREILLWRTGGTMHNAAVLGLISPARYILVTDAMLENLATPYLEAVAAHEVGHIRKKHLLWLGLATFAAVLAVGAATSWASFRATWWLHDHWTMSEEELGHARNVLDGVSVIVTLLAALIWFGWVSRRFEWQADAFAAADLARADGSADVVTQEAASRVSEALGLVAAYNGVAPSRFMWRHGSIRTRQSKLLSLGGRAAAAMPIDRIVGRIKFATIASFVGFAGLAAYEYLMHMKELP